MFVCEAPRAWACAAACLRLLFLRAFFTHLELFFFLQNDPDLAARIAAVHLDNTADASAAAATAASAQSSESRAGGGGASEKSCVLGDAFAITHG